MGKSKNPLKDTCEKLSLEKFLSFRAINAKDLHFCYEWANDPEVRKFSYNSKLIPFEDHQRWFNKKLTELNSHFFIVEYQSEPIGQIRFEGDTERIISFLIAPHMRGKGLGSLILNKGIEFFLQRASGIIKISGYVKKSNIASCKAFERAGFSTSSKVQSPYPDSLRFEFYIH